MGILNSGHLNTGLGNFGSGNLGFLNAGSGQTGWMNQTTQSINSLFGSDNVTGALNGANLNAANLNRAILDPAALVTGGYGADVASAVLLHSSLAGSAIPTAAETPIGGVPSVFPSVPRGSVASAAGSIAAPSVAAPAAAISGSAPAARNNSGNSNTDSGSGDSNPRNTPARDAQDGPADGIPCSGFSDKLTAARVGPGVQQPGSSD
jgi:hypothetical protein